MKKVVVYRGLLIAIYMLVIMLWSVNYKSGNIIASYVLTNLVSISVYLLFINRIYIDFVKVKKNRVASIREFSYIPIVLFVSFLILETTYNSLAILLVMFELLLLFTSKQPSLIDFVSFGLSFASVCFYVLGIRIISLLFILLYVYINTRKNYGYSLISNISMISIGRRKNSFVVAMILIFFSLISYILELDVALINIFIHIGFLVSIVFLLAGIDSLEYTDRKIESFYTLTRYVEEERDEFSKLLHDKIIQDIKASRTLLELKQPDVDCSKEILKNLEVKIRKIMNFYSSNIFDYFSFRENFENMIISIQDIYPNNEPILEYSIPEHLLKGEYRKLIMQISKELINNIYKHSRGTYINYEVSETETKIIAVCESDGATYKDYERTSCSKGGVLILRLLVSRYDGDVTYSYNEGILTTRISFYKEKYTSESNII